MEASAKAFTSQNTFERLKDLLLQDQREIYLSGLKGSFFSYLLGKLALCVSRCFLIITPDNDQAEEVVREVRLYLGREEGLIRPIFIFPSWETLPYDTTDPHPEKVISRIETLYHLQEAKDDNPIVVTPISALMQHCITPEDLTRAIIPINFQDQIDRERLVERLVKGGYRNVSLVEERGELSVRGGILDVFPPLYPYPFRLEFFGDRVDSIRQFNPATQRSVSNRESICILPVSEIIFDENSNRHALEYLEIIKKEEEIPSSRRRELKEKLNQNLQFPGMGFLLEFFYEHLGIITHYLPRDSVAWFYGIQDWMEKIADYSGQVAQSLSSSREEGKISSLGANLYLTPEEAQKALTPFAKVWTESLEILRSDENALSFSTLDNQDIFRGIMEGKTRSRPLAKLMQKLREWLNKDCTVFLIVYSEVQKKRLRELLENYGLNLQIPEHFSFFKSLESEKGELTLALGQIQKGFRSYPDKIVVLTEAEIFGEKISLWKKLELKEGYAISSLDDLEVNDFIVHVDYGIGQYRGLHSLEVGGSRNDFLLIEYRDKDRLYVPVYRLNLIQKYRGVEGELPSLHKLGGKAWLQTKQRIKKSIMAHAKELLRIYAARQALTGFAFAPRDQYYREFEALFEYEETRDQANAIEEVITDMENPRSMDRLICGDVGYGKTEVALRASFKAVMDNKQVAVLVPTTILAYQHYQTFFYRFRNFPISVAMMSRFQTKSQQKEIVQQIKEGKVDIVIGTHRLLQKDIGFKNLGLVIIDEEHRFGVSHKEKLKKLRNLVDVLALTATPIPRTLQLSLLGIRDLSIINSPPEDRLAVRTYITHFDGKIIREAIIREFMRQGQVFFVNNRVEKIEAMAHYLRELVPEASLAIAHGQMPEKELEKVMWAFHQKQVNLLLCTAIIESGMDFPNANTIIINRADRMGLAQLYQLRGRVGRSNHQAYAYLIIPKDPYISEKAKKRLKVIAEFTELSSGFRLANLDLETRGGGNILGLSQSGHMAQVGIELYYQLIEKVVKEIKGEKSPPEVDPEIRLKIPAYISEEYIPDIHQRLKIYKKMALGMDDMEIKDLENELKDRFGPLPEEVENLLIISRIKPALREYLISSLDFNGKEIILTFHPEAEESLDKILALIHSRGEQDKFTPDYKLKVPFRGGEDWKGVIEEVKKILQ